MPVIRKATTNDSAGILDCLREAFEVYEDGYTPEAFLDTVLTLDALHDRLATMFVFVALSDAGEIVGTVGGQVVSPGEGHLRGMAVRPAWQGSGLATQLLESVESELRFIGCRQISLDTTPPLQLAMRFYEKKGYRRSGKIADFFGMPLIEYVKSMAE